MALIWKNVIENFSERNDRDIVFHDMINPFDVWVNGLLTIQPYLYFSIRIVVMLRNNVLFADVK